MSRRLARFVGDGDESGYTTTALASTAIGAVAAQSTISRSRADLRIVHMASRAV